MVSTAISPAAVARVVGIETEFVNLRGGIAFLPQQIAVVGQGSTASTYPLEKTRVFSEAEAGRIYGYGSPIHLAVRELLPPIGEGVGVVPVHVLPLEDDGSGVAASGVIEADADSLPASETQAYRVVVAGIESERFVIEEGDEVGDVNTKLAEAVNAVLEMPVIASVDTENDVVELDAKWAGESGNAITLSVTGGDDVEFTITDMADGVANPSVQPALDMIGESTWITWIVNCLNYDDTDALDALDEFGESRWDPLVKKPLAAAVRGSSETSVAAAISVSETRTTDRTNAQVNVEGSPMYPAAIAAAAVARAAVLANNNPPHDYGSQPMRRIKRGAESEEWSYTERDAAVKGGVSTTEIKDGTVNLSDLVTHYAPEGEVPPAYRYVVDTVKNQQVIFNYDLEFNTPKWDGAPLVPDGQATTNPDAKKPSTAKAAIAKILDSLGSNAIISDPDTAKENTQAQIDSQNPKRLNVKSTIQLAGNSNIRSITNEFGFFFG